MLQEMRGCVRNRHYVVTLHAADELDDDGLTVMELECAILTGTIVGRQKEEITGFRKFLVYGAAEDGTPVTVVARWGATRRLVIVTVFRGRQENDDLESRDDL